MSRLEPVIRERLDADLESCVAALAAVHEADGYPARWPADPARWLTPRGMLRAWVAVGAGMVVDGVVGAGVVVDGSAVLGHVLLTETGLVGRLFVPPAARRSGTAARLLESAAAGAVAAGLEPTLEVDVTATAAIALYERAGWRYLGTDTATWFKADGQHAVVRHYAAPVQP